MNLFQVLRDNKLRYILLLFLISILPISLVVGSVAINSNIILINLIFVLLLITNKSIFNDNKLLILYLGLFQLIIIILFFFSIDKVNSFERTFGILRFLLLSFAIVVVLNCLSEKIKKIFFKFWTIIFILISLDLLFEFSFGSNIFGFRSYMPGRLVGMMVDELKIGHLYMGLSTYVLGYLIFENPKKYKLITFSIFIVLIISFLIGERANFLRLLFICYFLLNINIYLNVKKKLIYFNLIILILIGIFASIINYSPSFKVRYYYQFILPIKEGGLKQFVENSIYGKHYNAAYHIFNNNKSTGIGLKNFRIESFKLDINEDQSNKKFLGATHPHQIHLEFLSETGLIGYISWITFIILSIISAVRRLTLMFNYLSLAGLLYVIAYIFIPLPTGSFFSTYPATIFWINYALMMSNNEKKLNLSS